MNGGSVTTDGLEEKENGKETKIKYIKEYSQGRKDKDNITMELRRCN